MEIAKEAKLVRETDGRISGVDEDFLLIAGPCTIENREQTLVISKFLQQLGIAYFRGGAFKYRTSPYSFQGLGKEGLDILQEVKKQTGLKIVTEVLEPLWARNVSRYADILQIGTRNMFNTPLLKAAAQTHKPILLKRGMSASIEEFLLAAEYVMKAGNKNVILCERGIRTFEKATRFTLDLSAIPVIKQITKLPVIIDPSHAAGSRVYVPALSKAAVAAGGDGLLIEVHNTPEKAICDGQQSLTFEDFAKLHDEVKLLLALRKRGLG